LVDNVRFGNSISTAAYPEDSYMNNKNCAQKSTNHP